MLWWWVTLILLLSTCILAACIFAIKTTCWRRRHVPPPPSLPLQKLETPATLSPLLPLPNLPSSPTAALAIALSRLSRSTTAYGAVPTPDALPALLLPPMSPLHAARLSRLLSPLNPSSRPLSPILPPPQPHQQPHDHDHDHHPQPQDQDDPQNGANDANDLNVNINININTTDNSDSSTTPSSSPPSSPPLPLPLPRPSPAAPTPLDTKGVRDELAFLHTASGVSEEDEESIVRFVGRRRRGKKNADSPEKREGALFMGSRSMNRSVSGLDSEKVQEARALLSHAKTTLGVIALTYPRSSGVILTRVNRRSAAERAGLKKGDVIKYVDIHPDAAPEAELDQLSRDPLAVLEQQLRHRDLNGSKTDVESISIAVRSHDDFRKLLDISFPGEKQVYRIVRYGQDQALPVLYGAKGVPLDAVMEARSFAGSRWCSAMEVKLKPHDYSVFTRAAPTADREEMHTESTESRELALSLSGSLSVHTTARELHAAVDGPVSVPIPLGGPLFAEASSVQDLWHVFSTTPYVPDLTLPVEELLARNLHSLGYKTYVTRLGPPEETQNTFLVGGLYVTLAVSKTRHRMLDIRVEDLGDLARRFKTANPDGSARPYPASTGHLPPSTAAGLSGHTPHSLMRTTFGCTHRGDDEGGDASLGRVAGLEDGAWTEWRTFLELHGDKMLKETSRCVRCLRPFPDNSMIVVVAGLAYHEPCLRCVSCLEPLKETGTLPPPPGAGADDRVLRCPPDWFLSYGCICPKCGLDVTGTKHVVGLRRKWHLACWVCWRCGDGLDIDGAHGHRIEPTPGSVTRDPGCEHPVPISIDPHDALEAPRGVGRGARLVMWLPGQATDGGGFPLYPYCGLCSDEVGCAGCNGVAREGEELVVVSMAAREGEEHGSLVKRFHPECLIPLAEWEGGESAPRCRACGKEIRKPSDAIRALGAIWHASCFKCANCKLQVRLEDCFIWKGLPYCNRRHCRSVEPTSIYAAAEADEGEDEEEGGWEGSSGDGEYSMYSYSYSYSSSTSTTPRRRRYAEERTRKGFFESDRVWNWDP